MKNKKGFTLIEIIVSIALLAIIGVALGVSLNRSYKASSETSYKEFIQKIKSSALLYVNNTPTIINDLNGVYSYKILSVKELVENGFINSNLKNPNTRENINPDDLIKVYYNENKELIIDYPYELMNEKYLYVVNYNATYKSNDNNLCYKGLNSSSLQLVNEDGTKSSDLIENVTIKAYMEDGSECNSNKLNSNKIGTYKIKYEYYVDENNIKTAERTITIIPSKPTINKFEINYQIPLNSIDNDPTKARMTLIASDVDGIQLKYCVVPSRSVTSEITTLISNCKEETNNQNIGGNWKVYTPNNNELVIDLNLNEFEDIKTMTDIYFYVFVRNSFEEYASKLNEIDTGIYKFQRKVTLNAGDSTIKDNRNAKFSDGTNTVTLYTKYGTPFNNFLNTDNNQKYKSPIISDNASDRANYVFEGWKKSNTSIVYTNNSTFKITEDIILNAKWYKYCTSTTLTSSGSCNASCGSNGSKTYYYADSNYPNHSCPSRTEICYGGDCPPPTPPSSGGGESSGGSSGESSGNKCPVATICASSRDCDPAGSCCKWDWNNGVVYRPC